jgi:hypothetical protein
LSRNFHHHVYLDATHTGLTRFASVKLPEAKQGYQF